MHAQKSILILITTMLFFFSNGLSAQDKRYFNIQQVTHISGGWVAYSNGELYRCAFPQTNKKGGPACVLAAGLPSDGQSVSTLWAEENEAWVVYTDGQVYGCQQQSSQQKSPVCMPAQGLPH